MTITTVAIACLSLGLGGVFGIYFSAATIYTDYYLHSYGQIEKCWTWFVKSMLALVVAIAVALGLASDGLASWTGTAWIGFSIGWMAGALALWLPSPIPNND